MCRRLMKGSQLPLLIHGSKVTKTHEHKQWFECTTWLKRHLPGTFVQSDVESFTGKTLLLWSFSNTKPTEADFLHQELYSQRFTFREDVWVHLCEFCASSALTGGWLRSWRYGLEGSLWKTSLRLLRAVKTIPSLENTACIDRSTDINLQHYDKHREWTNH